MNNLTHDYFKIVIRRIITVMPLYYFSILIDVVYHILHCNKFSFSDVIVALLGINYFFNIDFPGSRYISIIFLLWFIYPLYCKRVQTIKKSFTILLGLFVISNSIYLLYQYTNKYIFVSILYILRGCMCFVVGNIIFHIIENYSEMITFKKQTIWITSILIILQLYILMLVDKIPSYIFIVIISILIIYNYKQSIFIIDNKVFAYIGKHSLAIFLFHECLDYPLSLYLKRGTYLFAIILFIVTFISTFIWDSFVTQNITRKQSSH